MGIFGPPNIKMLKSKGDVKGLIKALSYKEFLIRKDAAQALGEIGDALAVGELIIAISDQDWHVRDAAIQALGIIGDPKAIDPLCKLLLPDKRGGFYTSVEEVVKAIEKIGLPADTDPVIIAWIAIIKKDWDRVISLGEIAVEPLISALTVYNRPQICHGASSALGKIGDPRAVEPLLIACKDGELCYSASEALGEIGDPRAIQPLKEELRTLVSAVLTGINDYRFKLGTLKIVFPVKIGYYAKTLVRLGATDIAELLIAFFDSSREYFESNNYQLVKDILWSLGELRDRRAVETIIKCLTDGQRSYREYIYGEAIEALGKIGDPRAIDPLLKSLSYDKFHYGEEVGKALKAIGDLRVVDNLNAIINQQRDITTYDNHRLQAKNALKSLF